MNQMEFLSAKDLTKVLYMVVQHHFSLCYIGMKSNIEKNLSCQTMTNINIFRWKDVIEKTKVLKRSFTHFIKYFVCSEIRVN